MIARKFVVAMLLLVFVFILASCGGNSTPTTVPPTQPPTAEVATEEPTTVPTDAPAAESATEEAAEVTETASGSADGGVTATVTQVNTALRGGPGTAYEVLTRVTVNDVYPVVAQYGEGRDLWYEVTLADGTTAWAWSRVVTLNPADAVVPVAEEVPPAP